MEFWGSETSNHYDVAETQPQHQQSACLFDTSNRGQDALAPIATRLVAPQFRAAELQTSGLARNLNRVAEQLERVARGDTH